MKFKRIVLILLAMFLVMTFIGCNDSSSDSDSIGKGSGTKYVVTDLVDHTGVEDLKVIKGEGIEFKEMGTSAKIYKTMTLTSNNKFTASYDVVLGGMPEQKFSASGTWSRSGSTITINSKSQGGKWTATLSADGTTLEDDGAEPGISGRLIYTKQ